jgi:hypothetical protein
VKKKSKSKQDAEQYDSTGGGNNCFLTVGTAPASNFALIPLIRRCRRYIFDR